MSLSKTINQMGKFSGEGGSVPIYGADSINITRNNDWKVSGMSITSVSLAIWKGDQPVEYAFDFQLVAGIGDIKSRSTLVEKMRLMHSWAAHTLEGENCNSPLVVTLSLGDYIDCPGSIKTITTSASGPWEPDTNYPTSCKFSGVFLLMPGYTSGGNNVVITSKKLDASSVRSSFYRG